MGIRIARVGLGMVSGIVFRLAGEFIWEHRLELAVPTVAAGIVATILALQLPENLFE